MALSDLYTVNGGTPATGDTLTYTVATATGTSSTSGFTFHNSEDQLYFKKAAKHQPAVKRDPHIKKDFWDGVEWKEHTSYIPRKSITGKIIIGKMHKRWRVPGPRASMTQYAKTKELFEEKLKGRA
jgi:hypothetical protein